MREKIDTISKTAAGFVRSLGPTSIAPKKVAYDAADHIAVSDFGLSRESRAKLTKYAVDIQMRVRRAAEDVIQVGGMLDEAKKLLPQGQFGVWLSLEVPELALETAMNFIRIAKAFQGYDLQDVKVGVQTLNELSLSYVSPKTRDIALERIRRGEVLSYAKVKALTKTEREKSREKRGITEPSGRKSLRGGMVVEYSTLQTQCDIDVECELGTIPLATVGACYEFLDDPQPGGLMSAIGRIAILAKAHSSETKRTMQAVVVIRPTADPRIEKIIAFAESLDVMVYFRGEETQ